MSMSVFIVNTKAQGFDALSIQPATDARLIAGQPFGMPALPSLGGRAT
jgi:hypothetical protein